ncbi:MAG: pseudouridine-5'-phosphate glycosidase [Bacteroidota bacterium]
MQHLSISPEVAAAQAEGKAIVALESTIISHGMPYPKNRETALKVEVAVRDQGAIPATIALMNGKVKVGLSIDEIEQLAKAGTSVTKVSRRDIPFVLRSKALGATTVAATMLGAQWANVPLFATGGIGGVHRGAEQTFDISADLQELAQTNVAVVSAGVKSILDIPATLEYLETHGVPVMVYQSDHFPAFYTRESGERAENKVTSAQEIAELLHLKWTCGLQGGALIANPVPEIHACERTYIEGIIDKAITEAEQQHIKGKALTPFLLSRIEQLSKGQSLVSNIELVLNNARLGAKIAVALKRLEK